MAFGGGAIVDLYRKLLKGADEWPHYRRLAAAEAGRLAEVLATETCACGDAASVERELRQFLKAFPKDTALGRVQARLEAVQKGSSDLRFRCR